MKTNSKTIKADIRIYILNENLNKKLSILYSLIKSRLFYIRPSLDIVF